MVTTPRPSTAPGDCAHRHAPAPPPSLSQVSPLIRTIALSTHLASFAERILGVPRVRLYQVRKLANPMQAVADPLSPHQDSAFFKYPGDHDSHWHADNVACPIDTNRSVTIWLALHDIPAEMGPLQYASGSHIPLPRDQPALPSLPGVPLTLQSLPLQERMHAQHYLGTYEVRTGVVVPLRSSNMLNHGYCKGLCLMLVPVP